MRRPQKIIIDGYNVIYTDDSLRRTACRDLERARERLVDRLRAYLRGRDVAVTLVFDGRGRIAEAERVVAGKLEVMYSAYQQTADALIVTTLETSNNARAYIVVTSDMAHIGRVARRLGCEVIGSKRFLERIATAPEKPTAEPSHDEEGEAALGDTDFWLERFERPRETDDDA